MHIFIVFEVSDIVEVHIPVTVIKTQNSLKMTVKENNITLNFLMHGTTSVDMTSIFFGK
jgi:hypothetical protein